MQTPNRADCHCHTVFSDGTLTPVALLELAKEKQLTGLSITDHDTVGAYLTAIPYAAELGITLVPGIEISAHYQNTSIHVLGYAFDLQDMGLRQLCERLQTDRESRNEKILLKLARLNLPISMSEIKTAFPTGTIGRPHIAKLMVEKGYVKTMQKAFQRYLGEKQRCYVGGMTITVEQAIATSQNAGGFAVLAHPHSLPNKILTAVTQMPFDGIEVYYGPLSAKQESPILSLALRKNWMITGGSDFHGGQKSYASLGASFTPSEIFDQFVARTKSHSPALVCV
ncbi:MAG TPA: PHP domain-containing protein [Candidatus Berkiella sp.]|nr:PHP domain-containing protein [Candidatus Berkiella sp.]